MKATDIFEKSCLILLFCTDTFSYFEKILFSLSFVVVFVVVVMVVLCVCVCVCVCVQVSR